MLRSSADFIQRIRSRQQGGDLLRDGSFRYVVFLEPVSMRAIIRTRAELFTSTVRRRAASFDLVINGNYYGLSRSGIIDAMIGHDPVDANETSVEGQVIRIGERTIGDSRPQGFYIAEVLSATGRGWEYVTGQGNPPANARTVTAMGNVGPLISRGLPYGDGNRYRRGPPEPLRGDPGVSRRGDLTQRNNNTFASVERRSALTGKTIIAYHPVERALLVGVQPDGRGPGQSYGRLRTTLAAAGFTDAVFLDGSDSAMMWYKGRCIIAPGEDKDETMVVGLGFVARGPRTGTPQ